MPSDFENDYAYLGSSLPVGKDKKPYRTPSNPMSRRPSLHRRDSSPGPSSSPPRFNSGNRYESDGPITLIDIANDETISPLDPRRFTPTLHASLVSEILSLRRDMEAKTRAIDSLEMTLENAKAETETLRETLAKSSKENRSLKKQLQLLEGGSLSAMTELSKERDDALENIADFRKRLEQSQKRARTQEDEIERTQRLWERDKQNWEEERRNLERKVHVVEGRLKVVLNEVAAAQAAGSFPRSVDGDFDDFVRDGTTARASDTNSVRSSSVLGRRRTSTASVSTHDGDLHNLRYSVMSLANGHGPKVDGLNLADELAFDEEDEDTLGLDDHRPDSRCTVPDHERPMSMQSRPMSSMMARHTLDFSLDGHERFGTPDVLDHPKNLDVIPDIEEDAKATPAVPQFEYRDVGIQYTPPPSPKIVPEPDEVIVDEAPLVNCPNCADLERKHTSSSTETTPIYETKDSSTVTVPLLTTSSACQTTGELPSPPWTPKLDEISSEESTPLASPAPFIATPAVTTASISTQTDDVIIKDKETQNLEQLIRQAMPIPMITIEPPGSNPQSGRNSVVLPPQTKSISCQTNIEPLVDVRSCGMQTEEIRVDKRSAKLPAKLLPSAIIDPRISPEYIDLPSPPPIQAFHVPPKSAKRKLRKPPPVEPAPLSRPSSNDKEPEKLQTLQAYPGNNDNGPLSDDVKPELRRPFRNSSLFAGFEHISDDEWPVPQGDLFSDDELFNRPLASYTLRAGKLVTKPSPSILDDNPLAEREEHPDTNEEQYSPKSVSELRAHNGPQQRAVASGKSSTAKRPPRPLKLGNVAKQPDIRRTAMISSSTAAHQAFRPRSPSAPSIGSSAASTSTATKPPFPVPVRLSSRKIPTSASEGAQSPTPYSNGNYLERGFRSRDPPLRKVRSAAVVSRTQYHDRQQSHSPPTMSTTSTCPESPHLPPMPVDEITAPRSKRSGKPRSNRQIPPPPRSHRRDESNNTNTGIQQTSVVDAIAQTMVGEWMWKYVRRRKSFGMTDNSKEGWELGKSTEEVSANITGNGVRHKRWVWLAPYERAVMWSSKQPTSGSALLGKSGRKLTIQSVLDVKDDNPLPKGSSPSNHFNRSILILTPQRALKFTAMTIERHFVWLTALSFLSHSSMGANDLASLPPVPHEEYRPPPGSTLRRNPIRDSIRVAKGKARPTPASSNRSFASHPSAVPELPFDEAQQGEPINDVADPPNVPRFSSHSRKRSNTAPRLPPSAFKSFSNHTTAPSTYSTTTACSSDLYSPSTMGPSGVQSGQSSFSHRTSEASGPSSVGMSNFFEAVGTVRMEAFVDRNEFPRQRVGGHGHRSRQGGGGGGRRRRDAHYWPPNSPDTEFYGSEDGDVLFRNEDPFRGF
ncbi:nuclear migration protein [Blastomyces dermatitidis ER-3]|uniref:Nuclear migration protein n=1 Tax=Ajellomyces dermatitidis (strain ER-3 / ATCC MYA-2586) TaxID=559297 RepID=A0ABP2EN31_AJEDR|nr:nuclear migration protein [Blastomyces dermatitidis ER-3]EEQ83447.1 nuclear migration protein [Blastomyces dermatitidis ER-3]